MKKLLFFVMLLPIVAFGQYNIAVDGVVGIGLSNIHKQKPLDEQYIDWCNADSNKIIIGYKFIFEEHNGGLTGWVSGVDVYDSKYAPKDKNYIKYYDVDFKKPDEVYYLWSKQQQQDIPQYYEHQSYIRAEPIKKRIEPTFEGFVLWKMKYHKQ